MKLFGSCVPRSDGVGEPKKPPCVSCHNSGSQCVLVESRRGNNFRSNRAGQGATHSSERSISTQGKARGAFAAPSISEDDEATPSTDTSQMDNNEYAERATDDSLRMELRNPADALQILARSSDASSNRTSSHGRHQRGRGSPANTTTNSSIARPSSSIDSALAMSEGGHDQHRGRPPTTALDDYDLVQRGLLHPSVLPELLLTSAFRAH